MTGSVTALIAEDEAPQRHELRNMLGRLWPELKIVAECEDGLSALEALKKTQPDIAFLDIRMPGVSGLEVARHASHSAQVVFVTAYDKFAVEAFQAGAADYLLKPLRVDRLTETIARLRARHPSRQEGLAELIDKLTDGIVRRQKINWITVNVGDIVRMISINDVLMFQSDDKYTRVVTVVETSHIRTSLKVLMAQLDPELFWKVHRNAIVRVSAIQQVKPDDDGRLCIWLKDIPDRIRVSDAFRYRFRGM